MYLEKLNLWNYKNYEEVSLEFDEHVNVFVGKNGSGKTNILDSIYFLALTKSAFSSSDSQCIRHQESFLAIKGNFRQGDKETELLVSIQGGSRKVLKENGIEYEKISEHIGKYPVVLISPDDTEIVKEGSEFRRRFFDGIISQLDKHYLNCLLKYNLALKNRNLLLKMFFESGKTDHLALESYERLLVQSGEVLYKRRCEFITEFQPIFQKYYSYLVDALEETNITYTSPVHEVEFETGLNKTRQKDLLIQRTSFGVHRDDFDFKLGSGDLKKLGSQGQQKSFVIALKFAQYEILKTYKSFDPILLLDDIFDKLDDDRINRLLELIKREKSQIFITDARPNRTIELLKRIEVPSKVFFVDRGHVTL